MAQVLGSNQNIDIDVAGGTSYKTLVCLSSSSVNTSADSSVDKTNCGIFTAIGDSSMTVDFSAVCETAPSVAQVSYSSLLTAMTNKTGVNVRFQNPVVVGSSLGAAYYHQFIGYITSLKLDQTSSDFIKFSGTIASTGSLDIIP
jgi:hypothetical protein